MIPQRHVCSIPRAFGRIAGMAVETKYLGWDQPVLRKVVAFLLPSDTNGPVDLSADLIVVPTRQAGRRLRHALVVECARRNTASVTASLFP